MPEPDGAILLPPHVYVPRQNARHPEDWFDEIKSSVHADIAPENLHHTRAWQAGLVYFHAGYFWECHEVLEAVWMQTPIPSFEREMVQAIIQLANARLKLRMKRPRATLRLCEMVREHLTRCPSDTLILGMRSRDVLVWNTETETTAQTAI